MKGVSFMKRILSLFLALIMVLGLVPVDAFADSYPGPASLDTDKAYEEATIDGVVYKVYKLADLIDPPEVEESMAPMTMSKSASTLQAQGDPVQASTIEFYLELHWSTYDRPIVNVTMPVYVGPPSDSRSFTLGYFEVNSVASPGVDQTFNMVLDYDGSDLEDLVKYAFSQITIAIPVDMRYDFILAATKWDEKEKKGNRVIFHIEGRQSVMHGYGIRWFDTNSDNRDKVDAKWEGKDNQIVEVKLGTEDRNYSVYDKNTVNPKENINEYSDGTKYTKYDYYYNGKKITTYADADNTGKINYTNLAINGPINATNASLTIDGNRKGEKVLKNSTKYLYHSVGDYRTFHVLSMREALNVKLNSGAGKVGTESNKDLNVNGKSTQEIGHSEMIKNNESGNEIQFTTDKTIVAPKVKVGNKEVDAKFAGWATKAQTLTDGKLSAIEGQLVNSDGSLTDAGKTYTFTEKETTLYAVFEGPEEGAANVKYVYVKDDKATDLNEKYASIPESTDGKITGNVKDNVTLTYDASNPAPTFEGYKFTGTIVVDPTDTKYVKEEAGATLPTVYVVYEAEKIADKFKDKLDPQDIKVWKGDDITWKDGVKLKSADATLQAYLDAEETNYEDASTPARNSNTAQKDPFEGTIKITFKDNSTIEVPNQKLYVSEHKVEEKPDNDPEYIDPENLPDDKIKIEIKLGEGVKEAKEGGKEGNKANPVVIKTFYIKPNTGLAETDFPSTSGKDAEIVKQANYKNAITWTPANKTQTWSRDGAYVASAEIAGCKDSKVLQKDFENAIDPMFENIKKKDGVYLGKYDKANKKVTVAIIDKTQNAKQLRGTGLATGLENLYKNNNLIKIKVGTQAERDLRDLAKKQPNTGMTLQQLFATFFGADVLNEVQKTGDKTGTLADFIGKSVTLKLTVQEPDCEDNAVELTYTIEGKEAISSILKGKLSPQDIKVWKGDVIDWEKGVKKDETGLTEAQKAQIKDEFSTYENGVKKTKGKAKFEDASTPARNSEVAQTNPFVGNIKVTFSDGSELLVEKQNLYVSELMTGKDNENAPDDAIEVQFLLGNGVKAKKGEEYVEGKETPVVYETYKVKPKTNLDTYNLATGQNIFNTINPESMDTNKFKDIVWSPTDHVATKTNNKFTAMATEAFIMKHKFKLIDKDNNNAEITELPQVLKDKLPEDKKVAKGETYTPAKLENVKEVKEGEKFYDYTFKDWNPTSAKNEDKTFVGTWIREQSKSKQPKVDPVKPGDKKITGKGEPESVIEVELPDGTKVPGKTDEDGNWEVDVPEGKEPKDNDVIKVRQEEKGKKPSDPVEVTVTKDRPEPEKPYDPGYRYDPSPDYLNKNKPTPTPVPDHEYRELDVFSLYMIGNEDHMFMPNKGITRAEVAQIFARALRYDGYERRGEYNPYSDVNANAWYYDAVVTTTEAGVFRGTDLGTFEPNREITKAELISTIARFQQLGTKEGNSLNIRANHWARPEVEAAFQEGWLDIYTNGTVAFDADMVITRAEVATILNRAFGRIADVEYIDKNIESLVRFDDVNRNDWFYYDVIVATNTYATYGREWINHSDGMDNEFTHVDAIKWIKDLRNDKEVVETLRRVKFQRNAR